LSENGVAQNLMATHHVPSLGGACHLLVRFTIVTPSTVTRIKIQNNPFNLHRRQESKYRSPFNPEIGDFKNKDCWRHVMIAPAQLLGGCSLATWPSGQLVAWQCSVLENLFFEGHSSFSLSESWDISGKATSDRTSWDIRIYKIVSKLMTS
jgi:hypothetical protein